MTLGLKICKFGSALIIASASLSCTSMCMIGTCLQCQTIPAPVGSNRNLLNRLASSLSLHFPAESEVDILRVVSWSAYTWRERERERERDRKKEGKERKDRQTQTDRQREREKAKIRHHAAAVPN